MYYKDLYQQQQPSRYRTEDAATPTESTPTTTDKLKTFFTNPWTIAGIIAIIIIIFIIYQYMNSKVSGIKSFSYH